MNFDFQLDASKQRVVECFGRSVVNYQQQATLQRSCAGKLLNLLGEGQFSLAPGTVLEFGCGTGFITEQLVQRLPDRSLHITDLSPEMVNFCRQRIEPLAVGRSLAFELLDGEAIGSLEESFALIVSGFTVQWFKDPITSLQSLLEQLKPNGVLLLSFPGDGSFAEWRHLCEELNLPFTANPLLNPNDLLEKLAIPRDRYVLKEEWIETTFSSAADFFRDMKAIGAGVSTTAKQLTPRQIKQLITQWDQRSPNRVTVHHHVVYLAIQQR